MNIRIVRKARGSGPDPGERPEAGPAAANDRRHVYLRTVYPLNAGIPHAVDFPEGWEKRER